MNLEVLKNAGIDVDEGIHRCGDNSDLYDRVLDLFLADTNFASAEECLAAKDYTAMFPHTHELKGMSGNLSIKPMYEEASNVVALLRAEDYDAIPAAFDALRKTYDDAVSTIKEARG